MIYIFSKNSTHLKQIIKRIEPNASKRIVAIITINISFKRWLHLSV